MSQPPRFPLWVRLSHWLNAIALIMLIMSGLQIFNAHPALYAADVLDSHRILLSLPEAAGMTPSGAPLYEMTLFGHRFQTGFGLTAFGPPFTLGGWLEGGRRIHLAAAWIFLFNGVIYVLAMLAGKRKRDVWPQEEDFGRVGATIRDHFRIPPVLHGPQGELNALAKISYALVPLVLGIGVVATGLALSPQFDAIVPFWTDLFGGRQFARAWHFLAMALFGGFTVGHILLVALSGPRYLGRMITGRPVKGDSHAS